MSLDLYSEELDYEVHLTESALHTISLHRKLLQEHKPESCGIIIGEIREKSLTVIDISTPAHDDIRTRVSFHRKSSHHQLYLNKIHEISDGQLQYIGEWHTHPEPTPTPSFADYQGWNKLIHNPEFNLFPKLIWIAGNNNATADWFCLINNKKYYILQNS
ncbi:Mov34/MPN/PAD-1 family protein [Acinetobacter pittii]|uniref:Mov34/MPN/PAD-1 family protein n=1 Tax=Acinetobacter pittii TaxID=48296 RepID=UPI001374F3A1|nr:Mov34/MPN/PAD-1 family protein [Acinetobacter pittii]